MIRNRSGRVIAISTEGVMPHLPGQSAYVAGKRGMDGVLRVLAKEISPYQLTVNQVAPGWTITERVQCQETQRQDAYESAVPPSAGALIRRSPMWWFFWPPIWPAMSPVPTFRWAAAASWQRFEWVAPQRTSEHVLFEAWYPSKTQPNCLRNHRSYLVRRRKRHRRFSSWSGSEMMSPSPRPLRTVRTRHRVHGSSHRRTPRGALMR
jgi:hypothetical protein